MWDEVLSGVASRRGAVKRPDLRVAEKIPLTGDRSGRLRRCWYLTTETLGTQRENTAIHFLFSSFQKTRRKRSAQGIGPAGNVTETPGDVSDEPPGHREISFHGTKEARSNLCLNKHRGKERENLHLTTEAQRAQRQTQRSYVPFVLLPEDTEEKHRARVVATSATCWSSRRAASDARWVRYFRPWSALPRSCAWRLARADAPAS